MAFDIYEHPTVTDKFDRGHNKSCEYTNNLGVSCECDRGDATYAIPEAMRLLGWKKQENAQPGKGWVRTYGPHIIMLSKVMSGWQYKWYSGQMSMMSSGHFGTLPAALDHLWGKLAELQDLSMKTSWEYAARTEQLRKAGIEPKELGKKTTDRPPGVPGPLDEKSEADASKD